MQDCSCFITHRRAGEPKASYAIASPTAEYPHLSGTLRITHSANTIVKHEMEHAAELSVPLVVDIGIGKNWMETKE